MVAMKMNSLRREPVYETADKLLENEIHPKSGSVHSYCDPKTSFNNPFYSVKKKRKPSVMSVPGSVRRTAASALTRAATIHSSKGRGTAKAVYQKGRGYEVPKCEIELKQKKSKRLSSKAKPALEMGNYGYLELSGELRDPASLYIGLIRE